jgi:hypothetical protein
VAAGLEVNGYVLSVRRCSRGWADGGCPRKTTAVGLLGGPPRHSAGLAKWTTEHVRDTVAEHTWRPRLGGEL